MSSIPILPTTGASLSQSTCGRQYWRKCTQVNMPANLQRSVTASATTTGGRAFALMFAITAEDVSLVRLGRVVESLHNLHYTLSQ